MCSIVPEIFDPDLWIDPLTTTAIAEGTLAGGFELLPGRVVKVPPQVGGLVLVRSAKPLNEGGAGPPLRLLSFDHCAPQYVTAVPVAAFRSPITNEPDAR